MPAGPLARARFDFLSPPVGGDGAGNFNVGKPKLEFTVSAELIRQRGGEAVTGERLAGREPATLKVRQSADTRRITTAWIARDVLTLDIYNLKTIRDPDNKRRWLEIFAETGGGAAV